LVDASNPPQPAAAQHPWELKVSVQVFSSMKLLLQSSKVAH